MLSSWYKYVKTVCAKRWTIIQTASWIVYDIEDTVWKPWKVTTKYNKQKLLSISKASCEETEFRRAFGSSEFKKTFCWSYLFPDWCFYQRTQQHRCLLCSLTRCGWEIMGCHMPAFRSRRDIWTHYCNTARVIFLVRKVGCSGMYRHPWRFQSKNASGKAIHDALDKRWTTIPNSFLDCISHRRYSMETLKGLHDNQIQ